MRIWPRVGRSKLIVLIDSGSIHNFISSKFVEALKLSETSIAAFNVKVASGAPLKCSSKHKGIILNIQCIQFPVTLFAIPITGFDIILDVQRVEILGTIQSNWKTMEIEFEWDGLLCRLCGITESPISIEGLTKGVRPSHHHTTSQLEDPLRHVPDDLQDLLRDFSDLFEKLG
ncbi:unnamed protein product [Linum trigynum]|uniref:Uncharacterized protein n=1 Tax=Linum trigynum TaxID=586398 RepID=A0AAV2GN57_9ROSI